MPKRKRKGSNGAEDFNHEGKAVTIRGKIVRYSQSNMPATIQKYWHQRYRLFSKFDDGIWMDEESWYSVTPEPIALQIANEVSSCAVNVIVDGFCGAGGNAIAFALQGVDKIYAWDVDPLKIECAKHNAEIYGVADKIDFQVGDFFRLIKSVEADCVFLSPPWGGPLYNQQNVFDINKMEPYSAKTLMIAARTCTNNIVLYLPRQSSQRQLAALQDPKIGNIELQYLKCTGSMKALACYYGSLASLSNDLPS